MTRVNIINSIDQNVFTELTRKVEFDKVRLSYDGKISSDQVEWFMDILKGFFQVLEIPKSAHSRLMRISIEVIQNIVRHHVVPYGQDTFLILSSSKTHLELTSCNVVNKGCKEVISKNFENLDNLDVKQLRQAFREALVNSTISDKGGAGIGLVDIAYRSGGVPTYSFADIPDTDSAYFLLNVKLMDLK